MTARILIIEDNAQNLYLTTFLLQSHGYEVVQAPSGLLGIELAGSVRPDLILLDIQLPGLDGYSVVRTLRSSNTTAAIPVVAVTSYAMVGDRERALSSGCDGYIEKPIDPDTFVSQVDRFIQRGGTP